MNIPPQNSMYRGYAATPGSGGPGMNPGMPMQRSPHGHGHQGHGSSRRGPPSSMMPTSHPQHAAHHYSPLQHHPSHHHLHHPQQPQHHQPHPHAHAHHQQYHPALNPAQLQQQQQAAMQQQELAKRRGRKPTDKTLPDGLEEYVGEEILEQYRALQELERRMDTVMLRKRLDIQEAVNRNMKKYRTLRIWIWNTVENQPWQDRPMDDNTFDLSDGIEGRYRVCIEGKLLDDEDDVDDHDDQPPKKEDGATDGVDDGQAAPSNGNINNNKKKSLSHFFKAITVEINADKGLASTTADDQGSSNLAEWRKPGSSMKPGVMSSSADNEFDQLCFERKGDEDLNITINLVRDETPERFWVSKQLGKIIDREEEDRASVLMALHEYVLANGLQEEDDRRGFKCDERLRAIFSKDYVYFPQLPELITPHLEPFPPIQLPYTIRVGEAYHNMSPEEIAAKKDKTRSFYDVQVRVDDPLKKAYVDFINNMTSAPVGPGNAPRSVSGGQVQGQQAPGMTQAQLNNRRIIALDEHQAMLVQAIGQSKAKLDFLKKLQEDPEETMKKWMVSQQRDLGIILGEDERSGSGSGVDRIGVGAGNGNGVANGSGSGGGDANGTNTGGTWNSEAVREVINLLVNVPPQGGSGTGAGTGTGARAGPATGAATWPAEAGTGTGSMGGSGRSSRRG